jgi:putative ABC transport system permease protein
VCSGSTAFSLWIVGVVDTIKHVDLASTDTKERLYYSVQQLAFLNRDLALIAKTSIDPAALVAPLRDVVRRIDPDLPLADVQTMDDVVAGSLKDRRTPTVLLTGFGAVAMLLAGMGLYSVLAFGVSQRSRELAIRQALGANARDIFGQVMAQGAGLVAVGLVLGLAGTAGMTQYIQGLLFGVEPLDVMTIASVCGVLAAVAGLASYVPARRATRADPLAALHVE